MERWLPVVGYEGHYEVSDQGRVRSVDRKIVQRGKFDNFYERVFPGKIRTLFVRKDGYLSTTLSANGKTRTRLVHQLVCEAFHGERPEGMLHTRHLDGNRANNVLENVRWGTGAENMADSLRHGTNYQKVKTHCPRGHEYNELNTSFRPGRVAGYMSRSCNRCSTEKQSEKRKQRA